jgi:hypothetical protein
MNHTQQPLRSNGTNGNEAPRKRKSRWGSSNDNGEDVKRQSRWGNNDAPTTAQPSHAGLPPLPGMMMPSNLTPGKQAEMNQLQTRLREINDKMANLDREAERVDALPRDDGERSPSPPPSKYGICLVPWFDGTPHIRSHTYIVCSFLCFFSVYGPDGKRKNTRAVRWRERCTHERQDVLERIMNLNPNIQDRKTMSHLLVRQRVKKIPIPIHKHPNYNFIGLIIGPRGKTQKELEAKTGCKIAIRGKGSVKEGARGRRDGRIMEGDTEPLHVVITGDDQRAVDAAGEMMEQMLIVMDDEKNVHKQQQLRELALLNGTLKEEEFCQICAEKGHRSFECPRRFGKANNRPMVKCAICGDTSHPTRDCTQKGVDLANNTNQKEIDSDYLSFMAELDGKKVETKEPTPATNNIPISGPNSSLSPPGEPPPQPAALPPLAMFGQPGAPTPLPTGLLPPPPVLLPPPPLSVGLNQQPPPPSVNLSLPPPPSVNPQHLPPQGLGQPSHYYGQGHPGQHPNLPYDGYGNQFQQQAGHPNNYGQPIPPPQQPPPQQVRPGEETTAWDPSSYYGYGGQGGGAGGFNWWGK